MSEKRIPTRSNSYTFEEELTVVTATEEVREVGGLPCRVIRDLVFEVGEDDEGNIEYDAIEVTQDWYAQHTNGDTIYCGENTYEVEDYVVYRSLAASPGEAEGGDDGPFPFKGGCLQTFEVNPHDPEALLDELCRWGGEDICLEG